MIIDEGEDSMPSKLVTREVEDILTKKPLKVRGMGLSDNFYKLFDKDKTEGPAIEL